MKYKIRRMILNCSMKQWEKIDNLFGEKNILEMSIDFCLKNIGLISGLGTLNEEEKEFFERLYKKGREFA